MWSGTLVTESETDCVFVSLKSDGKCNRDAITRWRVPQWRRHCVTVIGMHARELQSSIIGSD
eukprot:m.50235 g.50235  ORF g.50235 m.50235 type:complete len:62 (+) comp16296_c0_seq1:2168-2353(+)